MADESSIINTRTKETFVLLPLRSQEKIFFTSHNGDNMTPVFLTYRWIAWVFTAYRKQSLKQSPFCFPKVPRKAILLVRPLRTINQMESSGSRAQNRNKEPSNQARNTHVCSVRLYEK